MQTVAVIVPILRKVLRENWDLPNKWDLFSDETMLNNFELNDNILKSYFSAADLKFSIVVGCPEQENPAQCGPSIFYIVYLHDPPETWSAK